MTCIGRYSNVQQHFTCAHICTLSCLWYQHIGMPRCLTTITCRVRFLHTVSIMAISDMANNGANVSKHSAHRYVIT